VLPLLFLHRLSSSDFGPAEDQFHAEREPRHSNQRLTVHTCNDTLTVICIPGGTMSILDRRPALGRRRWMPRADPALGADPATGPIPGRDASGPALVEVAAQEEPAPAPRPTDLSERPTVAAARRVATAAVTATRRTGPVVLRELLRRSPLVWRGFSPAPPAIPTATQIDVGPPPVAAAAPAAARGPAAVLAGRWIPGAAALVCILGIAGLAQPVLEAGNGMVSFTLLDVPYLGVSLLIGFLTLSLLPLIDLSRRRSTAGSTATAWLLVPAVLGALPVGVGFFALEPIPRGIRALWSAAPAAAVQVGPAAAVLVVADTALIAVAAAAIASRVLTRWRPQTH